MIIFRYHALGNDYLVADLAESADWARLSKNGIQQICDRNRGVGSDGILMGRLRGSLKPKGGLARASLRIFNPDGSEAEKSGNGIRIFARYLHDSGQWKPRRGSLTIELPGSGSSSDHEVKVDYLGDGAYRVEMGRPEFLFVNKKVSLSGRSRELTALRIGNPHCVLFTKRLQEDEVRTVGPRLETHRLFPGRTNVQWVQVVDARTLRILIWERGAGYTLASGSSSCAAFAAARLNYEIDVTASVEMPGGVLKVSEREDGMLLLTGPVTSVGETKLSSEFKAELFKNVR